MGLLINYSETTYIELKGAADVRQKRVFDLSG